MKNEFSSQKDTEEDPGIWVRKNIGHKQSSYAKNFLFYQHPLRIFFILLLFSLPFTVLSQGLVKGTVISYSKEGVVYSGATITSSNADKKDMIMVAKNTKPVKFAMKDIRRIEKTGQKWKLTPNWSYTESTFDVFKFTWHNGESQLLGITEWPTWNFMQPSEKQENTIWLSKLDWIEVNTVAAQPVVENNVGLGQNLTRGTSVRFLKKGIIYTGVIASVTIGEKEPFTTVSRDGRPVKVLLKDFRRIEKAGQKWKLTPNWSYTESDYEVYNFTRLDGQVVQFGMYEWPVWNFSLWDGSSMPNTWMHQIDWIDAGSNASTVASPNYTQQAGLPGLIKGSAISYSKKGMSFSGVVTAVTIGEKTPMLTVLQDGKPFRFLLKDVKRIENTGQKWKLTASWSSTEMNYSVYRFTWENGQTQLLGIAEWPVWDVLLSDGSVANNIWLEHLDWIESK